MFNLLAAVISGGIRFIWGRKLGKTSGQENKRQFEMKKCFQCTERSAAEGAFAFGEGSILLPEGSKRGPAFY